MLLGTARGFSPPDWKKNERRCPLVSALPDLSLTPSPEDSASLSGTSTSSPNRGNNLAGGLSERAWAFIHEEMSCTRVRDAKQADNFAATDALSHQGTQGGRRKWGTAGRVLGRTRQHAGGSGFAAREDRGCIIQPAGVRRILDVKRWSAAAAHDGPQVIKLQ